MNFVLLADELYKKGLDGSLSRCLSHSDKNIALGKFIEIKNFTASRNINMVTSTPYYAQANGQVEAANKILINLIKKQIVLPLEINLNTLRILKQDKLSVDDYWNAIYDELNDLDSEHLLALENMIQQKESVARNYNRRIKEKCFNMGELVLKVVLPMKKKSTFLGK
ncbi:uncharacterized protein LOC107647065 [Arachis ipaensis]|uniref:uncharacterized protein LOC107647065 n=1 Tax=Arachis ipaensis TaxID=130454 RepID=UPI0007AF4BFA|nr:uncharacterized protein LOC107647065 [Arachis ipaensis]XP_025661692.1 uncharacterized protein LOC112757317 [Arachis hypogaea]